MIRDDSLIRARITVRRNPPFTPSAPQVPSNFCNNCVCALDAYIDSCKVESTVIALLFSLAELFFGAFHDRPAFMQRESANESTCTVRNRVKAADRTCHLKTTSSVTAVRCDRSKFQWPRARHDFCVNFSSKYSPLFLDESGQTWLECRESKSSSRRHEIFFDLG